MSHESETIVQAGPGAVAFDALGGIHALSLGERTVLLPFPRAVFGIDGQDCTGALAPGAEEMSAALHARGRSSAAKVQSKGGELWIRVEVDQTAPQRKQASRPSQARGPSQASGAGQAAPTPPAPPPRVSLSFSMPADTRFHLAESLNVGRRIDAAMPVGERFASALYFNAAAMEAGGLCLRARSDHAAAKKLEVEILRHPDSFTVTLEWPTDGALSLAVFPTLADAMRDFERTLRASHGLRTLKERFPRAQWLQNVRLVLTADMMRSNGDISHDYGDVARMAKDLARVGCPRDTVLYVPGWNGRFDSGGPTYGPSSALGGEDGFRAMVNAIHESGFRAMIHTTGWGIDPYHPSIDELEALVVRDEDGELKGWQTNGKGRPPNRSLRFRTGRIPIAAEVAAPPVPDWCEALITVGGLQGFAGHITMSCGPRWVRSPAGWFRDNDECPLPYPLLLGRGWDSIRFEADSHVDWSKAWFRVRHAFRPPSGYSSWTWPILRADTTNPQYIRRFVESVSACVNRFGIDSVHIDAISFSDPKTSEGFLRAVQAALPDTPLSGEWTDRLEEPGFWGLVQNATQSLKAAQSYSLPREQQSLAMRAGVEELLRWMDQESEICDFSSTYIKSYPHLCAANAFVPIGKICNIFPARQVPLSEDEQFAVLREASRLRYVPGLRVNYRQYGLDTQTIRAIQEIARGGIH